MAGRGMKANTSSSGFDPAEKLNSNTLKRHPKMDLSRSDLLQLLSYLEGELQARDVVIATLKAEKAKQLLYQAKYGRFGLGDPFSAMQRDSDNMQDNTFDESAIRSMYDSQLAQLENLIATQRKAQMKMREQLVAGDRRYQKVCNELEDEKRKHAQDTAQGDDVTYMLEKERERLKQEVDFEKTNVKKMEKDMKKTLANLEEERANSLKHKQVALMLIKERKKLVEKMMQEKHRADQAEKLLAEERVEAMNMAEGLVQESKKSLKMEATMERQASEFDVEREQLKHKLLREENRNKELNLQIESLSHELENLQKQSIAGKTLPKDSVHSVEIKSNIVTPQLKLSSDRMPGWSLSNSPTSMLLSGMPATSHYEHEAELSPRTVSSDLSVRKRDNTRYASPPAVSVERSQAQYTDVGRVAPVGAVSDKHMFDSHGGYKHNVSIGGPSVVTSTGWITVQTSNPPVSAGQVSPRRVINVGRGTPPPIPPNKPIVPVTSPPKQLTTQNIGTTVAGYKSVHIPVTVVHTSTVTAPPGARTPKRDSSPSTIRKPAQFAEALHIFDMQASCNTPPTSDSFDFLGPEMADLQQLLVSMVSDPEDSSAVDHRGSLSLLDSPSSHVQTSSVTLMTSSVTSLVTSSGQQTTATIHESSSSTEQPVKPLHRWSDSPLTPSTLSTADSKFVSSVMVSAPSCPSDRLSTAFTVPKIPITIPVVKDLPTSPIHRYAATGNVESLRKLIVDLEADVNLPMKDGTTPAHCAAENGQDECLRILLERGCLVNSLRDNKQTPLHSAAAGGHSRCLSLLLHNGGNLHVTDHVGWTPLHWAAKNGHLDCCRLLLTNGANRLAVSNIDWTPLHVAVHSDASDCLDLFLTFNMDQSTSLRELRQVVCQLVDKDGWTLAYLAASRVSQECLSVILRYCEIDLKYKDHCGRSIMDVSSPSCQYLIKPYVNQEKLKHVLVAMRCSGPLYVEQEPFLIGHVQILPNMDWTDVDSVVTDCVESYFEQLDNGLRTKKVERLDPETTGDEPNFTLGLSRDSIHTYNIGTFFWKREVTNLDKTPQELLCVASNPTIIVTLKGGACGHDSLAFDLLMPVSTINNYNRMLDQYHSMMFYGPSGTRKEQLVKKLARHIVEREKHGGYESCITQLYLHRDYRHQDFVQLMKTEGCLLPVGMTRDRGCILLLFHLEKVDLLKMLGGLLEHIEHRGSQHAFTLQDTNGTTKDLYYFCDNFYLIATMDKPRSIGVDLGLQQRFRWVCLRVKAEPMKNFLGRHLLRRLLHNFGGKMLSVDDDLFKVVEWLLCVWHRLNDGVVKLGLPDIVFGPEIFLPCPLEARDCQVVLDWLRQLWNETISSAVRTTVLKGTADGQQKVANTALYVLMQRAIVPGCPLNGQDKESYLSNFCGSNELDVPLKSDRLSPGASSVGQRRPLHNGNHGNSKELTHAKTKHRNSTDGNFSPAHTITNINNKNSISFKRSSLSEVSLMQADDMVIPMIHESSDLSGDIQAKVPKLEIRSPVLGLLSPLTRYFSQSEPTSPSSTTGASPSSQRRSTFSTQSRIPQPSSKRSRSSENLTITQSYPVGGGSGIKQTGPFSFSLTMPTSPLFSFKFMEEGTTSTILSTASNTQTMENR